MLVSKLIVILLIFTVGTSVCYIGTDFINYYNYCNASRNILVKLPQTACFRSFSWESGFATLGSHMRSFVLHYLDNLAEHLGQDFFPESPRPFSHRRQTSEASPPLPDPSRFVWKLGNYCKMFMVDHASPFKAAINVDHLLPHFSAKPTNPMILFCAPTPLLFVPRSRVIWWEVAKGRFLALRQPAIHFWGLVGISRVAGCLYRCHTALKSKAEKKKCLGWPWTLLPLNLPAMGPEVRWKPMKRKPTCFSDAL